MTEFGDYDWHVGIQLKPTRHGTMSRRAALTIFVPRGQTHPVYSFLPSAFLETQNPDGLPVLYKTYLFSPHNVSLSEDSNACIGQALRSVDMSL
jgi:hypothetical protein